MKKPLQLLFLILYITAGPTAAQIIHVPSVQPTIQAGIDAALPGDTVLVDTGTYLENINFKGKGILVASHYLFSGDTNDIYHTVIDGSAPSHPDSGSVVSFASLEDTTSILLGFTITGGSGTWNTDLNMRMGGGVYIYNAGASILHNHIRQNSVSDSTLCSGGGIAAFNMVHRWLLIRQNRIHHNTAHAQTYFANGGGLWLSTSAQVTGNLIDHNTASNATGDVDGAGLMAEIIPGQPDTIYILSNRITYNTGTASYRARGGGVGCVGISALISGNEIHDNVLMAERTNGCGVWGNNTSFLEIRSNRIELNRTSASYAYTGVGCLVAFPQGPVHVIDNKIESNGNASFPPQTGNGGGLTVMDPFEHELAIIGNRISWNNAVKGGAAFLRDAFNATITNNVFSHNSADEAGAIELNSQADRDGIRNQRNCEPLKLCNNTFYANTATVLAGGVSCEYYVEEAYSLNNIFWMNTAPQARDIEYIGLEPLILYFSDIETADISGSWTGSGNLFADPAFVDTGEHPCALTLGSPCIDAGTPDTACLCCPPLDLLGNPRVADGDGNGTATIDIGAYEYGFHAGMQEMPSNGEGLQVMVSPNPFRTTARIVVHGPPASRIRLEICDITGKVHASLPLNTDHSGRAVTVLEPMGMNAGIYLVRALASQSSVTARVMLVR